MCCISEDPHLAAAAIPVKGRPFTVAGEVYINVELPLKSIKLNYGKNNNNNGCIARIRGGEGRGASQSEYKILSI